MDRSQIGGTADRPVAWFEVGYGSREIVVRTSTGVRYRADYDRVNYELVSSVIYDLKVFAGVAP